MCSEHCRMLPICQGLLLSVPVSLSFPIHVTDGCSGARSAVATHYMYSSVWLPPKIGDVVPWQCASLKENLSSHRDMTELLQNLGLSGGSNLYEKLYVCEHFPRKRGLGFH